MHNTHTHLVCTHPQPLPFPHTRTEPATSSLRPSPASHQKKTNWPIWQEASHWPPQAAGGGLQGWRGLCSLCQKDTIQGHSGGSVVCAWTERNACQCKTFTHCNQHAFTVLKIRSIVKLFGMMLNFSCLALGSRYESISTYENFYRQKIYLVSSNLWS